MTKQFKIDRSITFKIGFLYLVLTFINILIITTIISVNQGDLITENILLNSHKMITEYIEDINGNNLEKVISTLDQNSGEWILYDAKGEIKRSSADIKEVKDHLINIKKLLIINSSSNTRYLIKLNLLDFSIDNYIAVEKNSEDCDVFMFSQSINKVSSSVSYMIKIIVIAIVMFFFVNLVTAFVLYRLVVKPLEIISQATKRISQGDYKHSIVVKNRDEFGLVAFGFNQMTKKIKQNIENLNKQMNLLKVANKKIELMASTDELTQILNRRALFDRIEDAIAHANRYDETLGVLMFDIDHFKAVNDTYGHHAGDVVLKNVASLLKNLIRKVDTLGRYGGEEFVMIFPNTSLESMSIVAEKIRKAIEDLSIDTGNEILNVTISIGITEFQVLKEIGKKITPETFINFADNALYIAKETGRNKVEIYHDEKETKES